MVNATDVEDLDGFEIGVSTLAARIGRDALQGGGGRNGDGGGHPVAIASGVEPGETGRALAGEPAGTRFLPQRGRVSSFKLWLRYVKPARGRLTVDAGAERALRERGTSLLPVGVVGWKGSSRRATLWRSRCEEPARWGRASPGSPQGAAPGEGPKTTRCGSCCRGRPRRRSAPRLLVLE